MFRVNLANATAHRTLKPLYERHQASAIAGFLDPNETGDIYSGMVAAKSGPELFRICDGAADDAFGLFDLDRNPVINDLDGLADLAAFTIWQGGPDAYFQVDAPAFDTSASAGYALIDGTHVPLYAGTGSAVGKITSDSNGDAVAQLIEVVSPTRIVIRIMVPSSLS